MGWYLAFYIAKNENKRDNRWEKRDFKGIARTEWVNKITVSAKNGLEYRAILSIKCKLYEIIR